MPIKINYEKARKKAHSGNTGKGDILINKNIEFVVVEKTPNEITIKSVTSLFGVQQTITDEKYDKSGFKHTGRTRT